MKLRGITPQLGRPSKWKRRRFALFFVTSMGLLAAATPAAAGDAASFVGTWQHVGGESEQSRLLNAIDHTVEDLNFLVRPLARRRLVQSSPIPKRVSIEAEATQITVKQSGGPVLSSPLGSVRPVISPEGETIQLSYQIQKDALIQHVSSPDGARKTLYRVDTAGQRLVAEVTTTSRFFSRALVYTLTFKRVTSGQVNRAGGPAPLNPSL